MGSKFLKVSGLAIKDEWEDGKGNYAGPLLWTVIEDGKAKQMMTRNWVSYKVASELAELFGVDLVEL